MLSTSRWLVSFAASLALFALANAPVQAQPISGSMTYTGMLGRVPELTGYDFWVRQVRGGSSITRLVAQFQSSSEYASRVA